MRELLIDEQALDYFNKEKFHSVRFEGLVRQVLFAPAEPAPTPSAGRRIEIGWGADSYTLAREGQQVTSLPAKFLHLFECFGRKIASGAPGEGVTLRELNMVVDQDPGVGGKASGALRKAIANLNRFLQAALGVAPNGERWIESSRTSGYVLNAAGVDWVITDTKKRKELIRASQSVGAIIIDGATMQNNTPAG